MNNFYSLVKKILILLLLCPITLIGIAQTKSATQSNSFNYYDDSHYAILNQLFQSIVEEAPLTLFLPTKHAFEQLTQEQKDFYFQHPYTDLIDLLKGHMVSSIYKADDLSDGTKLKAINGNSLSISHMDNSIYINDAKVVKADVRFFRSIIHSIDKVIIPPTTVVDIIVNSEDHNTLEAAVIAAELADDLSGDGPFTVFAPTDDAFAALPEGTVEALLEDPTGDLAQILLYHVVGDKALSTDLSDGQMIETLQGKMVKVKIMDGKVYINDAMVTVADVMADNGVVHVINAVLIPPTTTVVDIIVNSENHNTLEAAVIVAELADDLAGDGPFTVFAPTDDAFAALPEGTVEALLEDPTGDLAQILLYHVVGDKAMSTDLSDGQMIETLQGKMIMVKIMDGKVYINDAMVTVADVMADNGVVHVIDAVLIPPTTTVVDIIVNSEDHNTLEAAVIAAELADDLAGDGPFTVFAPTDDAFAALPEGTVEALLEDPTGDLAQILLYHVVGDKAMSTDLSDGQMIETLQGKMIMVKIMDGKVYINDAMVTVADVMTDNGVVHVIDAVLIPPTTTVVDIIVNSEDHNTLEAAVIAAELADDLAGDGPFTVFAPTDDAFAALPEGTIEALLEDPTGDLAQILLYHVVGDKALSTDLSDGQMIETLQGKMVKVKIMDGKVYINDAMVTVADVMADNGVVHVIDAVLIPPTTTVVDIIVNSEDHNTLEAAVIAAELADDLSGDGPFTVFAPTDDAFAALPEGTVEALLEDPTGDLAQILLYHVVGDKAMSTDLSDGQMIETLQGKMVKVKIMDGKVYINDAIVTVADVMADNGVVHVIDAVLIPPVDIKLSSNNTYGDILVDTEGRTLYFFSKDADGNSMCSDGCLDNWPIFYTQDLALGEGLNPDDFGSIDRGHGMMQTTYKGWPLYYFVGDHNTGDTNGEGLGNKWFVAKPDYTIMLVNNQLTGLDGVNYKGDYTPGDEIIQYFTDDRGNSIYIWIKDKLNKNNFTAEDFSNNGVWPIYEEDAITVPSILDRDLFGTIDVFGKTQMTYNGWPLYFFGQDMMRGENKGVSVPKPGIWPVAQAHILPPTTTVVDIIVNSEDHNTLEAAVIAAELADDLAGNGPFTVFAPTDDAFAALPEGTVEALLEDPTGDLAQILLYHVVGDKAMSTDLSDGQMVETLQGKMIMVKIMDGKVYINDAMVTVADVMADNGVVHVIDAVLIPPTTTVVDIIVNSEDHNTLEAAVIAAELADDLAGDGPFTVFAPTDDAFAALPEGTVEALLEDPTGDLAQILLYHVVGDKAMSTDLSDGQMIETLQEQDIEVTVFKGEIKINNATIIIKDIIADNGIVHVIDAVLIPPTNTSVNEYFTGNTLRVYPNPASNYIQISDSSNNESNIKVSIYNASGRLILEQMTYSKDNKIEISSLHKGVYIVNLNNGEYQNSIKLIVN